jgi:hypothetical protein
MFERELILGRLVQPFDLEVSIGSYWLTSLKSKAESDAMRAFRLWIVAEAANSQATRLRVAAIKAQVSGCVAAARGEHAGEAVENRGPVALRLLRKFQSRLVDQAELASRSARIE